MKIRVLVVDDDEDLLFLATKFFEKEDQSFELVGANTDQEALQKLEEEDFDAIVCDHYLGPKSMTGLDLLEWVREGNPSIPFIIFTGRSQEAVAIRALNLGADYYLKKGTDEVRELFSRIASRIKSEVEQRRSGAALEAACANLEKREAERTAELEEMNERLIREIDERQKAENSLLMQQELGNTLCRTRNLTDALDAILKSVVQLEGVDSGGIYLLDNQTGKFGYSSNHGLSAQFLHRFFNESKNPSIDKPIYMSKADIQSSTIVEGRDESLTAAAIIPVYSEDKTIAILNLASHTHSEIPERVKSALEAVSIQIAAYMARFNAENMISESRTGVETVTELLDDMFLVVGKDSEVLHANSVFLERFGLSLSALAKKHFHDLYERKRTEEVTSSLQQAFNGKSVTLDIPLCLDGGNALRAITRIAKAMRDNQEVLYVIVHEIKSQ